jgi:UrcA family protein
MKKIAVATLTAAAIGFAGFAAQADEFSLDLSKINVNTAQGQRALEQWKTQVALAQCGPVDMPQPIDLADARAKCQIAVRIQAQALIDAALARQEAALTLRVASRD